MTILAAADTVQAAISPEDLLAGLRWRYAVKKFDPSRQITDETWQTLEEALVLTPSSAGLQPWRFFVVDDPALRAKLKPASYNQSQITDAAKLVVFAAKKDFGPADVERHIAHTAEVRQVPLASLDPFKQMLMGLLSRPTPLLESWVARQVYIALGNFLTSAAALGVDACPMEGFDSAQYDQILGLAQQGYTALVVATAGYRDDDDTYAQLPKVRFARTEVVAHL